MSAPTSMPPCTACFRTEDCVDHTEGSYTFEVPAHILSMKPQKVSLASCEFPMVQHPIEEGWNRLYYNEGIRMDVEADRMLHVQVDNDPPVEVLLPLRLNRLRSCTQREDGTLLVECTHPHGLFSAHTGRPVASAFREGIRLICGSSGEDAVLPSAEACEYLSATKFLWKAGVKRPPGQGATYLHVPTCPSPSQLCEWLTEAAHGCLSATTGRSVAVSFRYQASTDQVHLSVLGEGLAPGTSLRVLTSPLSSSLGISTTSLRWPASERILRWPCSCTRLWSHATLPAGAYGPCLRPLCTGQPLRFGAEVEAAMNRFYYPMPSPSEASSAPATKEHRLVFSDPSGRTCTCLIPPGRYNPETLCECLSRSMTKAVSLPSEDPSSSARKGAIHFRVARTAEQRFLFSCMDAQDRPRPFSLHFHHPLSVDPSRFGFHAHPLSGQSTYVAPMETPATGPGGVSGEGGPRASANLVRITERGASKQFVFHAVSAPSMVGVVAASGPAANDLVLHTYVNASAYAHGCQPGDVVQLGVPALSEQDAPEQSKGPTAAALPEHGTAAAVVLAAKDGDTPGTLRLHVPRLARLGEAGTCLQVSVSAEPWNLHFGLQNSVPGHRVGFPRAAVQHGLDGSVRDAQGRKLPPYVAPNVHDLEHPDYVLLTFSEGGTDHFTHTHNGETKHIFCKLSLYPLYRDERNLPRETRLHQNALNRFRLSFWNPDLRTPYRFHGRSFSFSLTFS